MCMAHHTQFTQKNKFVFISLQCIKKEVNDEVDFFHTDEHERFLQIDTMVFNGMLMCSQIFQNSKFAMTLQYLKKEVRDENYISHADKHQSFLQVGLNTLWIRFFYKEILPLLADMTKLTKSAQSSKFAISLQYPKKVIGGVHFLHADKHQSFCKLALSCLQQHFNTVLRRK